MRVKAWCALFGVGLVGCGGVEPELLEGAPEDTTVHAQACAPGKAFKVKDVLPPGTDLPPWKPSPFGLTNVQGTLYFAVDLFPNHSLLWKSDGTTAGTVPVKDFPAYGTSGYRDLGELTAVGHRLFFSINDPTVGRELWVSDGTGAGTRLVADLTPGAASTSLSELASVGGTLSFFRREPATNGLLLWKSDGTAAGTVQVLDLETQASLASSVVLSSGLRVFILQDAVSGGTRVWRSDGTAAGTYAFISLDAGEPQVRDVRSQGAFAVFALVEGGNTEIWKTDGTATGTVRLETFGHDARLLGVLGSHVYVSYPTTDDRLKVARVSLAGGGKATVTTLANPFAGQEGAQPYLQDAKTAGNKLYLSVAIGSPGPAPRRVDLWGTDGTAAGTVRLSEGLSTSDERWSTLFDSGSGTLIFGSAGDSAGEEPWVTNGTPAGTGRIADLQPMGSSNPTSFLRIGTRIFFVANGGPPGNALWSLPANVTCPALSAEAR
ncbi:hypothetical protein D7V97_02155 [Corallococcus sp. CA053C]|uniref:ELWxxDGT repeat protein n=1 Tax=Corallococcus sp. CA053C TaxID=2316732 RepID=UPI000EA256BB|nr:ELWxxDGT repeat protein [Corallococcus sp. CA053C]RKH14806.1 hypothetical protein D7V97_02155 [Corallococcus sp. CA053C]